MSSPISRIRPRRASLIGSLLLVAIGLAAGLGVAELPLNAGSSVHAVVSSPASDSVAYQAYRAGERDASGILAIAAPAGAAYQAYRAGERAQLSPSIAFRAWLDYRSGERGSVGAQQAWLDYRSGERESVGAQQAWLDYRVGERAGQ